MAQQKGIIKLKGTMGDITFFKTRDGYMARERGGVDANRIANDPAYQRTRENGAEFARAGKAGKLLRSSIRPLLLKAADGRMVGRLHRELMKVIKADATSERGLRNVIDGNTELLSGFEFNERGKLGTSFYAPFEVSIDRVAGTLTIDIATFIPANMVTAPIGATHFKIISAGAEVDFETETYVVATSETAILLLDATPSTAISQVNAVTANSTHPLFLVLGIEFYQEVNGQMYSLRNGAFNPLAMVSVDHPV